MKKIALLLFFITIILFFSGCVKTKNRDRYLRPMALDEDSLKFLDYLKIKPVGLINLTNPTFQVKYPDNEVPKVGNITELNYTKIEELNPDIIYVTKQTHEAHKNVLNSLNTKNFKIDILDIHNAKFVITTLTHLADNHDTDEQVIGKEIHKFITDNDKEYTEIVKKFKEVISYRLKVLILHTDETNKLRVATKYSYLGVLCNKLDCINESIALHPSQEEDVPYYDVVEKDLDKLNFNEPEFIIVLNDNKKTPEATQQFLEELFNTPAYQKAECFKEKKYRFYTSTHRLGYGEIDYIGFYKELSEYIAHLK